MEVVSVRPTLFAENTTDFGNNGIGVLFETIRCDVIEENNGPFDMELEYPQSGEFANEIKDGRLILAKPNDKDEPHAFRINEIEKDLESGIIFARCTTITNDLNGNLIKGKVIVTDANAQTALNLIKSNLIEPTIFEFVSDIEVPKSTEWARINPLLAIAGEDGSVLTTWGGQIKRTNDRVYVYSRRGKDKVTVIRPGKNLTGFNMVVSTKGIVTKMLPTYIYTPEVIPEYEMVAEHDGSTVKKQKDVADTERPDPVTVTGDVVISPNVDKYAVNYYANIDYSSDDIVNEKVDAFIEMKLQEAEDSPTIVDTSGLQEQIRLYILSLLNEEAAKYFINNPGIDEPSVEFKADMLQLSDSPEWELYKNLETIGVSDTVDVYIKKFDVDVEMTIKSINYDSIGERVLDIVAGTSRTSMTQANAKKYEDIAKELEKYIETVENGVYNSISRTADGMSRRFSGYTEPPANLSRNGDLWFREVGESVVETYIYNGGSWVPIVSEIKIEEMQQAIEDAALLAEDARKKSQDTIDDINGVLVGEGFTTLADLFASKISEDEHSTLFFQEAESIGLIYEKDGVTEAIIMISEGKPYIKGEHIILDGNTIVDGTFTVTETMFAANAVIDNLMASGIDARDVTIINLDANNITGGDLDLSKGLRITNNGVPVMQVDAATGKVTITSPNLATKEDLEAVDTKIGDKAAIGDLESLAGLVSDIGSKVGNKAEYSEFKKLLDEFDARVIQDIADKDQLAVDLATMEGRTTLVEILAGDAKTVTEFLETVITQSEEGIFIANGSTSTGILISDDRISFMDNNIEVAYISNQTMQINHGIFVESATIGSFKFEKIPGTTILGITWVGV